jgi:hypothetical protein
VIARLLIAAVLSAAAAGCATAVVVTGTRQVRQEIEAISPVTTVASEQLELSATLTTDSLNYATRARELQAAHPIADARRKADMGDFRLIQISHA